MPDDGFNEMSTEEEEEARASGERMLAKFGRKLQNAGETSSLIPCLRGILQFLANVLCDVSSAVVSLQHTSDDYKTCHRFLSSIRARLMRLEHLQAEDELKLTPETYEGLEQTEEACEESEPSDEMELTEASEESSEEACKELESGEVACQVAEGEGEGEAYKDSISIAADTTCEGSETAIQGTGSVEKAVGLVDIEDWAVEELLAKARLIREEAMGKLSLTGMVARRRTDSNTARGVSVRKTEANSLGGGGKKQPTKLKNYEGHSSSSKRTMAAVRRAKGEEEEASSRELSHGGGGGGGHRSGEGGGKGLRGGVAKEGIELRGGRGSLPLRTESGRSGHLGRKSFRHPVQNELRYEDRESRSGVSSEVNPIPASRNKIVLGVGGTVKPVPARHRNTVSYLLGASRGVNGVAKKMSGKDELLRHHNKNYSGHSSTSETAEGGRIKLIPSADEHEAPPLVSSGPLVSEGSLRMRMNRCRQTAEDGQSEARAANAQVEGKLDAKAEIERLLVFPHSFQTLLTGLEPGLCNTQAGCKPDVCRQRPQRRARDHRCDKNDDQTNKGQANDDMPRNLREDYRRRFMRRLQETCTSGAAKRDRFVPAGGPGDGDRTERKVVQALKLLQRLAGLFCKLKDIDIHELSTSYRFAPERSFIASHLDRWLKALNDVEATPLDGNADNNSQKLKTKRSNCSHSGYVRSNRCLRGCSSSNPSTPLVCKSWNQFTASSPWLPDVLSSLSKATGLQNDLLERCKAIVARKSPCQAASTVPLMGLSNLIVYSTLEEAATLVQLRHAVEALLFYYHFETVVAAAILPQNNTPPLNPTSAFLAHCQLAHALLCTEGKRLFSLAYHGSETLQSREDRETVNLSLTEKLDGSCKIKELDQTVGASSAAKRPDSHTRTAQSVIAGIHDADPVPLATDELRKIGLTTTPSKDQQDELDRETMAIYLELKKSEAELAALSRQYMEHEAILTDMKKSCGDLRHAGNEEGKDKEGDDKSQKKGQEDEKDEAGDGDKEEEEEEEEEEEYQLASDELEAAMEQEWQEVYSQLAAARNVKNTLLMVYVSDNDTLHLQVKLLLITMFDKEGVRVNTGMTVEH
ncbi:hypothetical protein CBR_g18967 [Chara braunii]|uniref:Uncharacterized protein n=1 Tax=Chara braunii TaxID=69332 RepID=A0A388KWW4_CHABU|nr:hypothetical protein CBR_g18967 [Chara braunii]|eukprot:GBG74556.1 hypothetical protein CBR_g18967 [Chara braunii]